MYYSMNVLEIITLMFVLFLWALSIYWLFKRYRKLTTIERADLGYRSILDTKKDSIANQNSSLEEVLVENETNNYEKSDSSSFLPGDGYANEGEIEIDEENSSLTDSNAKLENLKVPSTKVSSGQFTQKSFNKNHLFNLKNHNNLHNFSTISSNVTSATASFTNLKDSIFMFNNMIFQNSFPEQDSSNYAGSSENRDKHFYEDNNDSRSISQSKDKNKHSNMALIRVFKSNSMSSNSNKVS